MPERLDPDALRAFDPLTGQPPSYFAEEFVAYAARARRILHGRSAEQIRAGYAAIVALVYTQESDDREALSGTAPGTVIITPTSPTVTLQRRLASDVPIGEIAEFANPRPAELFAILVLAYIGHAHLLLANPSRRPHSSEALELERAECAIAATEAITIAELIRGERPAIPQTMTRKIRGEVIDQAATDRRRKEARRSGKQKYVKLDRLKAQVLLRFDALRGALPRLSNRKAAKLIAAEIPEAETKGLLMPHDREKTFEEWIGEYKRGLRAAH